MARRLPLRLAALAGALLAAAPAPAAKKDRFFQAEPGFTRIKDLPEDLRARIDSVRFDIKDAYEGADVHTPLERWGFDLLNKLHIESREGILRQRLLFAEGDSVSKGRLIESEKALRDEQFLADAVLELGPERGGARTVKVTTYDQWTTAPIVAAGLVQGDLLTSIFLGRWDNLSEQEWLYGFGLWESNLAGTGTKLGGSYKHDLERNTLEAHLSNQSFTRHHLQGSLYAADLSDGHSYHAKLAMPLRSREAEWAFSVSASTLRLAEFVYFDANRLSDLPDSLRGDRAGSSHVHRRFEGVTHDSLHLTLTRSFGRELKVNVGPSFFWQERYQAGGLGPHDTAVAEAAPLPASASSPWLRRDALLGGSVSLQQYEYFTARNYRNLKWNETIETGWRLTARAAMNQEWLGADGSDLWFAHEAGYGDAWRDAWYASCSLSTSYFLDPGEGFENGRVDASFEAQWKPIGLTSSVLVGAWNHLFATPKSRQLVLGALDGLYGYPSFYYSGQARLLLLAEQRVFPEFELASLVPAYSLFLAAGNTWPTYAAFVPSDLHYSLGLGVRIGRSKSPTKGVQHISFSWPLGEEGLPGFAVSILAKKNL